ncbi:MAG: Type 1 glutamine amidotransferase-like domain-containing protein [Candidatus Liptonbacteria bacterium]|nr:Type 1 glutamine amidotransferase-like domain-containing protein [Candidatus Liptonbacteria bacterium]
MKLLLTSGGITNPSIAEALFELVGKKPEETSLVFIPTASNKEAGDKSWFINDLVNLKKLNLKSIDIADISAIDESAWKPRFDSADILFFEGGSNYHLMRWVGRSGLAKLLPEYLKTKVYAGLSAGSMITSKDQPIKFSQAIYEEDFDEKEDLPSLNLVDFYFLPHLDSPYFKNSREGFIGEIAEGMTDKIYAMDDQSALKVVDGKVEIISEGKWFVING